MHDNIYFFQATNWVKIVPLIKKGILKIEEKQLIQSCLRGDIKAQKALYHQFAPKMMSVCIRYAKDRSEAQDMLQEGFFKVFTDLHQYSGKGNLGGWIRKVVVHAALRYIRKHKKNWQFKEDEQVMSQLPDNETDILGHLAMQDLVSLIQGLPVGYQMVFNMFVIEGFSHQEIAELLGISVGTSKSQLYKAKLTLRKAINHQLIKSKVS